MNPKFQYLILTLANDHFKYDLALQLTWTNVSNELCPIFLKTMNKYRSYGLMTILALDIKVWPWPSTYLNNVSNEQLCQIILKSMHKCRSYGLMTIIWPSSVTLTFNLPEQIFQMALLLLKDNNCANFFFNPWINVQVMAWTSSIYHHFIIWPSSVTLTINLPEQMFQMALLLEDNCAKLFWNPCISVQVMASTYLDGCTIHMRTHIHRTEVVITKSHSPQARSTKILANALAPPFF